MSTGVASRPVRAPLAPDSWLRLPRRTARLRLTVLYSGLFLLLGTGLLAITYFLTTTTAELRIGGSSRVAVAHPVPANPGVAGPPSQIHEIVSAQRSADLGHLLTVSWLVLAAATLGSAVLGWFAAGRVLRPLRDITATARTISAGSLHQRLALEGPDDEFRQLGDTLDDLLARLEASFEAQRRFVANASHELRTPMTLERTLLQVALADPDASVQSLRATCEELLVHQADHERLLEALLTLATSQRGLAHLEPVDLSAVVRRVLAASEPEARRRGLRTDTALAPASPRGDPALVERLVANLIDNAIEHNVPDGQVTIGTAQEGADALLTVANSGPRVPAEEIERLFEPFQRLDGSRVGADGHHGLGLSIVRAIADAHGASVTAWGPAEGGLSVTVRFPGVVVAGAV